MRVSPLLAAILLSLSPQVFAETSVEAAAEPEATTAVSAAESAEASDGGAEPLEQIQVTATRAAVVAFQQHTRILANGRTGATVWRLLLAHLDRPNFAGPLCDYSVGNGPANWGTAAAIGQLNAAAAIVVSQGHGQVALGDIGFEHGGDIPGHQTHEHGMDVDVRLMRDRHDQCRWGGSYRMAAYDRAATRALIRAIRSTARGHVKLIYFNDPVLIREGLVRRFPGHDDHLHIRYCERVHPVAAYDC